MRLSIRYKILAVTGLLLVAAIGSYTWLASFIFMEQKTALLYDINHSVAVNTAAQVRSSLLRISDQMKLYTVSRLISSGKSELRLPSSSLRENHVLAAGFFLKTSSGFESEKLPPELPSLRMDLATLSPFLDEAMRDNHAFWSVPQESGAAFFLASRLDLTVGSQPRTYVTVAEIDPKPFLELLQSAGLFDSFLIRPGGEVLAHIQDGKSGEASGLPTIADHPLIEVQKTQGGLSGVRNYDFQGSQWYGAYAPVGLGGLMYISQANRLEVTSALSILLQRSLLFGLIVLTATFIASILFSRRLTANLRNLTQGAIAIGAGDLKAQIKVRSGDEVEALANSFNQMVDALRASREAIERYNHELEAKVEERTAELRDTNAQIKAVQEKLLSTTQLAAVGEVAGRTAHELLNPLTAIISRIERSQVAFQTAGGPSESLPSQLMEILQAWSNDFVQGGASKLTAALQGPSTQHPGKTLLEEDLANLQTLGNYWQDQTKVVSADLDFVRDQAQRIHRIVDKMRELVRSSVKSDVSCRSAVEEATGTMADFFAKQGVALQVEWDATEDTAELNRDELVQIVTNLMRNGYQALKESGRNGAILIRAQNHGHLLCVDVIDNGTGIAPEHRERLFQQGFTTKGPSEGTGLGLAICRRYAHAFGGEVELLFSESGRGTCFRITIPLKTQEAVA